MSRKRTAEQRELPKARQRRLRRTLMEHYANEPTYTREVEQLRLQWKALGGEPAPAFRWKVLGGGPAPAFTPEERRDQTREEFDNLHSAFQSVIAASVANTLRLVDRRHKRPLEWAIDWLDDDILELARVWRPDGVELQNSTGDYVSFRKDRKDRKDREAYPSLLDPMPKFTLSVTLTTAELTAPGGDPWNFDPSESWVEDDFEHGIFDREITGDTWKELEKLSCDLVKEGIKRMRAMFEEQLPREHVTRTSGRGSESNSLKLLCQYLLTKDYRLFERAIMDGDTELSADEYDALLPDSAELPTTRLARKLSHEMGIDWPRKPAI